MNVTDNFNGRQRNLKVDIWDKLNHKAHEVSGIRQEIHFSIISKNRIKLAFNGFNRVCPFLILLYINKCRHTFH